MSLNEYEKQLKDQMTGFELKLFLLKHEAMEREENIKAKVSYKLEVQDIALRELKIHSRKDLEHAMMAQNDAEGKLYSMYQTDGGFDNLLQLDKKINTLEDAMGVIVKLKNGLANILSEKRKNEGEIVDLKVRIDELTKEKVSLRPLFF
jgi:hypothetical protein